MKKVLLAMAIVFATANVYANEITTTVVPSTEEVINTTKENTPVQETETQTEETAKN
ncbi:MAG: hypothetical protein SZ59_C0001G0206 [candidate division TM6 bacterium GW2011_GWF2_28_16]|nr:MAG: hypothetical protein SZ59_C0001G0206 [candidate division TM6 bacterium GW2011_GWF2_28_16]